MAIMFGNGQVKQYTGDQAFIMKTEQFVATDTTVPTGSLSQGINTEAWADASGWKGKFEAPDGKLYKKINPKFYDAKGATPESFTKGDIYFCTFDLKVEGFVIEVSANSFPGTYYVTGDTYARSEASGKDEFYQFIIPKAKVQSENTITMEAEGDPSTFNMNLKVLRPRDGQMMKLVKYGLTDVGEEPKASDVTLVHNHVLKTDNSAELAAKAALHTDTTEAIG